MNLTVSNSFWITCNLVQDFSVQGIGNTLIHFFANEAPDQAYISYDNPVPREYAKMLRTETQKRPFERIPPSRVYHAQFRVLDDTGAVIDFNGIDVDLVVLTYEYRDEYDLMHRYFNLRANEPRRI